MKKYMKKRLSLLAIMLWLVALPMTSTFAQETKGELNDFWDAIETSDFAEESNTASVATEKANINDEDFWSDLDNSWFDLEWADEVPSWATETTESAPILTQEYATPDIVKSQETWVAMDLAIVLWLVALATWAWYVLNKKLNLLK